MRAIKSRLGLRFIAASSIILGLAMLTLAGLSVRAVVELGQEASAQTEQAILAQARATLPRDVRERAARCGDMLGRAEHNVRLMARRAAFCLDSMDFLGRRPAVPGEGLSLHQPNGIWTNSRDALASVVYWDTAQLTDRAVRLFNALSWAQQSVAFAESSLPEAEAAWLIMKSGIALYHPNIHHVELMPPPAEFDYRNDICFTFTAPANNPRGETRWTDVYQDTLGQGLMITAGAPVLSAAGDFLGSAGVDIRVQEVVQEVLGGDESGRQTPVRFLFDSQGDVLAFPLAKLARFGMQVDDYSTLEPGKLLEYNLLDSSRPGFVEAVELALSEPSGLHRMELDGAGMLMAFRRVGATDWVLAEVQSESDILQAVELTQRAMQETVASTVVLFSAVTGLCLLLSVVLSSTFFSSRVLKPVQRASESVGDIARGRLSRRVEAAADDEIGDLARGLNVMAERLESRDASLREAEARYRSMVENAMEGIFRTSLDGEILRVNPALARILGYESEEALLRVGDVGWLYAEPDQRRRILNRLLQHGTVEFEEIQGRREDGNPFWVELNCRLARDESGEPRWIDGFVQDISERKAREEAERELQAAEAASRAKSMFLANMSHEIRTPMNIILGATDMLEQSALTGDQRGCVRLLRESGGALLGLISDVLDLSKIEAGKIELQEVDFDLPDLVAQTAGIFSAQAAGKGLELSWGCAPELPQVVRGDPNRLRQVLTNLLGNAVKFTSQGEVRLEASLANPPGEETEAVEVLFMVSDTGPGVEPGQRSAIFETFTQADASTSREHGGAGLGLAITRSLVELMGGSVWCESRAERGSVFWVSLPFAPAEGPPAATEAQQIAPADLPPASVLMVEDNELNRMLFEYYLESTPCTAAFAENGEQGVEAFRAGRFDIVFMDVSMPVMDGLEAARAIREIERDRGEEPTPIVALTAHGLAGDEQRCLEAGCTLYLAKPVRQRDVLRCIRDDAVVRGTAGGGED